MKSRAEVKNEIFEFIVKVSKKITRDQLDGQTPLLEKRVINSLQVMELLLLIEKLTGKPVDVRAIKPGVFANVDQIMESFFKDAK